MRLSQSRRKSPRLFVREFCPHRCNAQDFCVGAAEQGSVAVAGHVEAVATFRSTERPVGLDPAGLSPNQSVSAIYAEAQTPLICSISETKSPPATGPSGSTPSLASTHDGS